MSTVVLIGAGLLAVGGLAWLRARDAASASASSDPCAALAALGVPEVACRAGRGLLGGLATWWQTPSATHNNLELNGEPAETIDPGANAQTGVIHNGQQQLFFRQSAHGNAIDPIVSKFKGGCEPIEGKPGWAKCAPGTGSIVNDLYPGKRASADILSGELVGEGRGDPVTRRYTERNGARNPVRWPASAPAVPEGGSRWWHKGKATVCEAGAEILPQTQDHRPGASPCARPSTEPVVAPPSPPASWTPGGRAGFGGPAPGPDYVWVDGRWQRRPAA